MFEISVTMVFSKINYSYDEVAVKEVLLFNDYFTFHITFDYFTFLENFLYCNIVDLSMGKKLNTMSKK